LTYQRLSFWWQPDGHPFLQRAIRTPEPSLTYRFDAGVGCCLSLVSDHIVHGRIIFPGAAYLELARAAACSAPTQALLKETFFLKPLAVESSHLVVECMVASGRFEVRSQIDPGGFPVTCDSPLHCTGAYTIKGEQVALVGDPAWTRCTICALAAHTQSLYDHFSATGLQYGPGYRTLAQAWCGLGSATTQLHARPTQQGTHVHPADLDDALCASALVFSDRTARSSAPIESAAHLPFALDCAMLHREQTVLWAVRCAPVFERTDQLLHVLTVLTVCMRVRTGGARARGTWNVGMAWYLRIGSTRAAYRLQNARSSS
jgi:hypothetical protein